MPSMPAGWRRRMANRAKTDRLSAEKRGHRGETWAAWWLRLKGHRILGRRIKTHAGEIDLVTLSPFRPGLFYQSKNKDAPPGRGQRGRPRAADPHSPARPPISGVAARL